MRYRIRQPIVQAKKGEETHSSSDQIQSVLVGITNRCPVGEDIL
jgi:hypothetical protein